LSERILVAVAWPYANGPLHIGHIAGAYLPADIFARFHRIKGNDVLMVSGSDQHGTPITLRAEQEGTTPQEIASRYHQDFISCWERFGITFDLFTSTSTTNHTRVVHQLFSTLEDKGYIYADSMSLPYCPNCQRHLPDRYVRGICPHCSFEEARGDQCDNCGKPLNPVDLTDARCQICSTSAELRSSDHLFFRLSAFRDQLLDWAKRQTHWRQNVFNFTVRYLEEGLKDRAITRDISWGVPVPRPGFEDKCIYVWFEAVIGYLAASQEWAKLKNDEDAWKPFWGEQAKSYYFIGKDNIPFHTLIWPSMLMGVGELALPYDVPANEFLNIEGRQLSTSRNWAIWLSDYLDRYDPEPLRYALSINMPETGDTDFSWHEFVRRNNDELLATYGNLVHRVLTFTYRNFDGCIPAPSELDAIDQQLLVEAKATFGTVDSALSRCQFREALRTAMGLAQQANRYLDGKAPWKAIKQDRQACANSLYVSLSVISNLRLLLYPFLPFSSQKLHSMLGFPGNVDECMWEYQDLPKEQAMQAPSPLFIKLDESVVEEETNRLRG